MQEVRGWLSSASVPFVEQVSGSIRLPSDGARASTVLAAARIQPEGVPALLTATGKADGSHVLTAISLSESEAASIASSTTLSWKLTSAGDLNDMSKSTIATECEITTVLRTLNYSQWPNTPDAIIPAVTLPNGSPWPACNVTQSSSGGGHGSSGIPTLSALGSATENPVVRAAGWNVALKPSYEPIVVARKPWTGTVAENVLRHGTGALNIDGCRVGYEEGGTLASNPSLREQIAGGNGGHIIATETERRFSEAHAAGRWPANVVLSHTDECRQVGMKEVRNRAGDIDPSTGPRENTVYGKDHRPRDWQAYGENGVETVEAWECSPECPVRMLDEQSGEAFSGGTSGAGAYGTGVTYGEGAGQARGGAVGFGDRGGASRFYYCAKAGRAERNAGLDRAYCETCAEWVSAVPRADIQAGSGAQPPRATTEPTTLPADGSDSSTILFGNANAELSPKGSISTIATGTSRTTGSRTLSSSPHSTTSANTPSASDEQQMEAGSVDAESVERGSPPRQSTSTSLPRDGSPTAGADPATSGLSSEPSSSAALACPDCGGVIKGGRNVHPLADGEAVGLDAMVGAAPDATWRAGA